MRLSANALFAAILALGPPAYCRAADSQGTAPFNFIFMDAGARPAALGGAYAAAATDADALLYNPAGLGALEKHGATFMHSQYFQGVTQEYGAFAYKIGAQDEWNQFRFRGLKDTASQGWGLMINQLSFGKIQRTTLSNPDGSDLDGFGIRDWAAAFGYGREVAKGLSVGGAVKGFYETIDRTKAFAPAVDAGLLYRLGAIPLSVGAAVQNVGPQARFNRDKVDLPLNVRAGLAYRWVEEGLFVFDVNRPKDGGLTLHAGAEYEAFKRLAVRAGYNGRNDAGSGVTLGFGVLFPGASLDYAFAPFGDLGIAHRISLSLHW